MTTKKTKTDTEKSKGISHQAKHAAHTVKQNAKKAGRKGGTAMMGGAAGAVVGAAIGGVAGAALADEQTRKKVSKTINEFSKVAVKASEQAEQLSARANDASRSTRKMIKDTAVDAGVVDDKTKS
jgi:hypothetical protein